MVEPARYVTGTPFLGTPPELTFPLMSLYRRLRCGRGAALAERARTAAEQLWYRWRYLTTVRQERSVHARMADIDGGPLRALYFRTEQAPDRENRVALGRRRDALGIPRVELRWRLGEADTRSIAGWLSAFETTMAERGLGAVVMPPDEWPESVVGGPHHMGTTRMSADPKQGVVDADCRVHTSDNLYVAGSSVFSTSGYANPTLTIVALALRLADHLRDRLA
jgi:choline dehydrogenase-like flavoprotein